MHVEKESQKVEEDAVISAPPSLARGSSECSRFTQLVHGTARPSTWSGCKAEQKELGRTKSILRHSALFRKQAYLLYSGGYSALLFVLFCLVLTSAYETRATVISIAQVGVDQGHRSSKGEFFTHYSRLA